jgi:acetyl esterase/lipase
MAHETTPIETQSPFGVTARHTLTTHEPASEKLVIMLPGRGYTNEGPVMFHTRQMALENGWDVLAVQYGFQAANADLRPEQFPLLPQDVSLAVEPVLKRGYREICIVGKSLGTPLAAELAKSLTAEKIWLILFTPIAGSMNNLNGLRTLAVIGTADPVYTPELVKTPGVQWKVFEGFNHGLIQDGNWRVSVSALHDMILACERFNRGAIND